MLQQTEAFGMRIWFSYNQPVAFEKDGERVVSENIWSRKTGKDIDTLDPTGLERYPHHEFVELYDEALSSLLRSGK